MRAATGEAADAWMAYGLADVVNQRRMIDDSPAGEEFKKMQRGKLDALLALAESHDCRRVRLLVVLRRNLSRPRPRRGAGFPGPRRVPSGGNGRRERGGPMRQLRQLPVAARHVGRDRGGAHGAVHRLPLPPALRPELRCRPPDRRAARQDHRQDDAARPRHAVDVRHRREVVRAAVARRDPPVAVAGPPAVPKANTRRWC